MAGNVTKDDVFAAYLALEKAKAEYHQRLEGENPVPDEYRPPKPGEPIAPRNRMHSTTGKTGPLVALVIIALIAAALVAIL